MDGDALEEGSGERARSWYLTREEIERGSPSRRDGVGAAKEAELRTTYCCFIRDVCNRLQLPQITFATAIMLCHRFYLHQSHAKNEWQIEDTPCLLKHVVIAAYETMYRKTPDAAKRIHQEEVLAKQKALILVGETLLLSTIRFDFNIQHPYEPLKLALKNLGISQKEVRQRAMSFINDMLPTTLVVQFKPHFIAAGSLFHAARVHNFVLPSQNGKAWWNEFDVAPKQQLQAIIQQMSELLFKKRDPCSMLSASKPVPTPIPTSPPIPTPTDKQQQIKPPPTPALMDKQKIKPIPTPTPTLTDRQQKIRTPAPALRRTQSSMRSFSSSNTKASSCVTVGSSFDKLTSSSASNEENRYQQTDEENQYHQRTNEDNQYRRTNEQNQHRRRMDEKDQYRRRMDEEDQYRRRMDEEDQYRWRMNKQHRRTYDENLHRRTYDENLHRRTYEENLHRRTNEEKQYRRTNEEKQYRHTNEEKQYRRTDTNHDLVPVDQRLEKQSYRGTLKSDRGYHATIIMDLTIQKRRIQEDGPFPVPVYMSDTNDWRSGSFKKQKLERR